MQDRLGPILVGQGDDLSVTVDAHGSHAQRPTDRCTECIALLGPVEFAVEALVARLHGDAALEFPVLDVTEHLGSLIPG